jgi:glycyl-tRNA synthetase beta chain
VTRTKKGEYIYGKQEISGASTEDILYNEIPKILKGLEFPKTMVWDEHKVKFPRPVRWLVTLLDKKPLRFEYAGVKGDRYSMPNQHFSFKPIRLEKPREYINFLRHGGVVVDPNERRKLILKRVRQTAEKLKGKPVYDDATIEEINCTIEYPEAVNGEFNARFLDLPEEVLMSVLKSHGNLIWMKDTNKFICVFSAKKKALPNVQKGYTRVIEARLYDASFYYKNDVEQGLKNMLEQTKAMVWFKDLGTIYDKAERLSRFVEQFKAVSDLDIDALKRAAQLCKADLLSQMVRDMEFTSLQGIMGYYYAKASGVSDKAATAIKEHYLPRFVGDTLPKTREGALLSICDKIDNVIGTFFSGQRPSGSYDPLGIRRNGYAVVNLIDAQSINVSLYKAIDGLLKLYGKSVDKNIIFEFIEERLTRYLQDKEFRYDEINAVLEQWNGDIVDARLRCEALKKFRGKTEFAKLVIGQKRVRNILKGIKKIAQVNVDLFEKPAEKKLYGKGNETASNLEVMLENRSYAEVLNLLLAMRSVIDTFFDDVLVMCKDEKLKKNRLALVSFINQIFLKFADFSQIVIEGEKSKE